MILLPKHCKCSALPIEIHPQKLFLTYTQITKNPGFFSEDRGCKVQLKILITTRPDLMNYYSPWLFSLSLLWLL